MTDGDERFNAGRLLRAVFAPEPGERAAVLVDVPHGSIGDDADWRERRAMAAEWREELAGMDLEVLPLIEYPATGSHNADLPRIGDEGWKQIPLADTLAMVNLCVAMTRFSATAPLSRIARENPSFRAASMPGVLRRMERTALAADYGEVARKAAVLKRLLDEAEGARIEFSTGDELFMDLRFRAAEADDGQCRAGAAHRVINLPGGEAFIVPYEGERDGEPSRTAGRIPVVYDQEGVVFDVAANRIRRVLGNGYHAARMAAFFAEDAARANIAELGLGCNERAEVTGAVLEDEKAGLHWAYGRSEHLGGVTGPDAFSAPGHVVHQDIVYARGCPVEIRRLDLVGPGGKETLVMKDGEYLVF